MLKQEITGTALNDEKYLTNTIIKIELDTKIFDIFLVFIKNSVYLRLVSDVFVSPICD